MKKILILIGVVVFAAAGTVFAIRLSSPEDAWLCQNGQWVKHGNPKAYKPEKGCGDAASAEQASSKQNLVGNDRDEHGCIGSAGYAWCESKNKCLRQWEEACTDGVNFIHQGTAAKNNPGLEKDQLYIIYEEPGKPAQSAKLKFDGKSLCGGVDRKIVCMALSVSDFGLYSGRPIKVMGIEQNNTVTVREVEYQDDAAWNRIVEAIRTCQVKSVFQAHSLQVSATLKDKTTLSAKEPKIDDIIDEAVAAKDKCGNIIMATE